MKNNKWIWRTLTVLMTLVILVGVGAAGFRIGFMQGANADGKSPIFGHPQRFDNKFTDKPGNDERQLQKFDHQQGQDRGFHRGFQRGMMHGRFSFLFGLVHLAILGLILWAGYKLYQKSGWQFVKVNAPEVEPAEVNPAEVKPEAKKKK
ncbi:MAG: hypothetical protein H7Y59_13310 [Anaerolineales bacterium]|nr:hypothetical protein [Anaerolineales bacterium]